jgi:Arc/MetJ-type ribon-helix-helix transcriptional regulator
MIIWQRYDIRYYKIMSTTKVAITIDRRLLGRLDAMVKRKAFANRSRAIQQAVEEKLDQLDRSRLARECAKLDPSTEQTLADEGLRRDLAEWPEY